MGPPFGTALAITRLAAFYYEVHLAAHLFCEGHKDVRRYRSNTMGSMGLACGWRNKVGQILDSNSRTTAQRSNGCIQEKDEKKIQKSGVNCQSNESFDKRQVCSR